MTNRHPALSEEDPQKDTIYRWIRNLMALDMLIGAGFAIYGLATEQHAFVLVGFGIAFIGAALFIFFTMMAKRRSHS